MSIYKTENLGTFPHDGIRTNFDNNDHSSPDASLIIHPESYPSIKRNPVRMRICAGCRDEVESFDMNVFTCKCCFRFFHDSCCKDSSLRTCLECINWHQNHDQLTVTNLVSVQHLSGFHDIPSATHRLLNAALVESQRKVSWLWKASLEEIRAQNDRLNNMPTLGQRLEARKRGIDINDL